MSSSPEQDVDRLIAIFEASDLSMLRIVTPNLELHLSRQQGGDMTLGVREEDAVVAAVVAEPTITAPQRAAPQVEPTADGHVVRAPMVGTVYRSPEPGAPSFVQVGDEVHADSTVCIVEAMKVFTAVAAGVDGVVEEIQVETGDFVEFEQPMLRIATRPKNGV